MGLFDWLFGKKPKDDKQHKVCFQFIIYDEGEEIENNKWYQKASWKNKNFIKYSGAWDSNWRWADEGKVKVVGISRGNRADYFIHLAREKDFKMFLQDEPDNPVNRYARKIMASATIDGDFICKHVGYLPDEIATRYADAELDIRPWSAFLPTNSDLNIGVEVALLVRSARYLKKQKKE